MRRELLDEKQKIENKETMQETLNIMNRYINKHGLIDTFDYLGEIMKDSKDFVENLLQKRKTQNEGYDINQARKTIAGNNFQFLVLYLLILNIQKGNLPPNLIVLKTKQHKIVDKYATIKVGNETQKPDLDLIAFSEDQNKPIIIYSCKTSLRERAGQTYRWKLLIDITENCPTLVEKYGLEYSKNKNIFTGLITTDFYNEIIQPQQRGVLKFFDYSYVAKSIQTQDSIKKLSSIINDLNSVFS